MYAVKAAGLPPPRRPPWRPGVVVLYYMVCPNAPSHNCDRAMTRIAILGATGYTALELIKILLRHPEAEIVAVTSRQEGQPHIAMIHPALTGRVDLAVGGSQPGRGCRQGRLRVQLSAARRQCGGDSRACWTPAAAWSTSAPTIG